MEIVNQLLSEGVNLIAVRDKDEIDKKGVLRNAKTPFWDWKRYQAEKITPEELAKQMTKNNTEAVAMVCGRVSGNLEIIDIDSKFKPGIDALLFADLYALYPDVFKALRINRTPSGGYHIIYRIKDHEAQGNQKLAGYKDEAGKSINFIETRGEGGFALAPPSMGYTVHQANAIPLLTWEDRCSIIALCQSYTEIVKEVKPLRVTANSEYYSQNPWEDYANSEAGANVLLQYGWRVEGENSRFVWFTRPDKKKGVSASYNKEKRVFYFFTSSTEFEPSKGYFAGSILAMLQFGNDTKATFKHLVDSGYGKIKRNVEKKIVENAAKKGFELPANVSDSGKKEFVEVKAKLEEIHPYGTFWEYSEDGKLQINRAKVYEIAHALGFRKWLNQLVKIVGHEVYLLEESMWFDELSQYIKEDDKEERYRILNAYEAFLQKSGSFSISRMRELDKKLILNSTKTVSYKFFLNGFLEITAKDYVLLPYTDLDGRLIWNDSIIQREFMEVENIDKSLYWQYLENAVGVDDNLLQIIGFYLHDYKDETLGYIGVMVEQVANPEDGGGAGKNVFASLLRLGTSLKSIPASQVKFDDKLLSSWNMEKVFSISDAPRDTDYAFLKDLSTGEGSWKKLFKDPVTVPCDLMPKFLLSTNFSYELSDGGLKRRIVPIEFTDFYTTRGGIDVVHGKHFPNEWPQEEFSAFDNIMVEAIMMFLKSGCKIKPKDLTASGWEKRFRQTHNEMTFLFIEENWSDWISRGSISTVEFNEAYDSFLLENGVNLRFRKSSTMMNRALQEYSKHNGVFFNPKAVFRPIGLSSVKGRTFTKL